MERNINNLKHYLVSWAYPSKQEQPALTIRPRLAGIEIPGTDRHL